MGNQKLKWTAEEEEGLKAGVAKYGVGKWKNILGDSEFKHKLANRSNVDLKDKWRNMCCNVGQVCGANVTTPEEKATATGALPPNTQNISSAPVSKDDTKEKPPKSSERVKSGPKYNEMILDALSSFKDHNGSDFGSIVGFIEKKYEVSHFRRLLSSKLRKLIMQGEIQKLRRFKSVTKLNMLHWVLKHRHQNKNLQGQSLYKSLG